MYSIWNAAAYNTSNFQRKFCAVGFFSAHYARPLTNMLFARKMLRFRKVTGKLEIGKLLSIFTTPDFQGLFVNKLDSKPS